MKKFLLTALLCTILTGAYAQNYKNDGKPYAFFCQIVGEENLVGQLRIKVLWDNKKTEQNMRDEKGQKIEFGSMTDALNFFSKRGWEYVDCAFFGSKGNYTIHYLMKKMVTSDEEAKEGLYFKGEK